MPGFPNAKWSVSAVFMLHHHVRLMSEAMIGLLPVVPVRRFP